MNSENTEKQRGGFWIYLIALSIFVFASGKNLSYLAYTIALLTALLSLRRHLDLLRKISGVFLLFSIVAIFSYYDVDVRRGPNLNLRWMPVVYNLGSAELVRKEEARGHKENVDFIVKRHPPFANYIRKSLVFIIP